MCNLEKDIAYHCAPAMAGIKASSLINCPLDRYDSAEHAIEQIASKLHDKGITIHIVSKSDTRILLLVYRRSTMLQLLSDAEIQQYLSQCGYAIEEQCELDCICCLADKIHNGSGFPHEIGVFLGYPLEDVQGFIDKQQSKYSGMWQVYGDVDNAKSYFRQIDRCQQGVMRRIEQGHSLEEIFRTAM